MRRRSSFPPLRLCPPPPMPWANNGRTLCAHAIHSLHAARFLPSCAVPSVLRACRLTHTSSHTHRAGTRRSALPDTCSSSPLQPPPKTMRAVLPVLCLCLTYAAAFMPATPASALRGESFPPFSPSLAPLSTPGAILICPLPQLTCTSTHTHTFYPPKHNTQRPPPLPLREGGRGWR
jgi:hypothetical protein